MSDQEPSSHESDLERDSNAGRGKRKRSLDEAKSEDDLEGGGAQDSQLSMQSIDEEFMCTICLNTLTEPYIVIPCLHSFDKECLVSWWRGHTTCPTCKSQSTSAKPAFQLKSIITHLNKKRKNSSLPPGSSSHSNEEIFPGGHGDEDDEDENLSDEDEDAENNATNLLLWPCMACTANNPTGYICPNPIPLPSAEELRAVGLDPITATPPARETRKLSLDHPSVTGKQGVSDHQQCRGCGNYVPNGINRVIQCITCDGIYCSNIDPHGCPMNIELLSRSRTELMVTSIRTLIGYFSPMEFRNNAEEVARFENYVQNRPLDIRIILSGVFDHKYEQAREDLNDAEADRLWGPDSKHCTNCSINILSTTLFDWWKEERKRSLDRGDNILPDRPDCWYGRECRTQTHNRNHAERYNHVCENTHRQ